MTIDKLNLEQWLSVSAIVVLLVSILVIALKELWYNCKRSINCKVDEKVCEVTHKNLDEKLEYIQEKLDDIHEYLMEK